MSRRNRQLDKLVREIRYRDGARVNKQIPAEVVYQQVMTLEKEHGLVQPEALIAAARPKSSSIHGCFEWDDSLAAEEFRKVQARTLIRSIEIVYTDVGPVSSHVYVHIDEMGGYKSSELVVKNETEFDSALSLLLAKLTAAEGAVEDLKRLAGVKSDVNAKLGLALHALETARSIAATLSAA